MWPVSGVSVVLAVSTMRAAVERHHDLELGVLPTTDCPDGGRSIPSVAVEPVAHRTGWAWRVRAA